MEIAILVGVGEPTRVKLLTETRGSVLPNVLRNGWPIHVLNCDKWLVE